MRRSPPPDISWATLNTGDLLRHFRASNIVSQVSQLVYAQGANGKRICEKKSMRVAVDSFCLECVGYQREEIKVCTDKACPLWAYRPYSVSKKAQIGHFKLAESTNAA